MVRENLDSAGGASSLGAGRSCATATIGRRQNDEERRMKRSMGVLFRNCAGRASDNASRGSHDGLDDSVGSAGWFCNSGKTQPLKRPRQENLFAPEGGESYI